jgi:AcrR family transcriptional regulator
MPRKTLTNPKKQATQPRARATVDALLEATARILVKEGYDRASTNRIANAAGVSIGSLYQYYPSKEALVAGVVDRHMQDMTNVLHGELAKVMAQPVKTATRKLVATMIDAHRVDPKLHRVLVEQIPRVGRLENVEAIDRETLTLVRAYLDAHRDEIDVPDVDMAAFVCVMTVEALTHAAVMQRPEMLRDEKVDAFVEEVTRLIVGYLRAR